MRQFLFVIGFFVAAIAPTFAQKAEIDAANARWMELFNKGDFAGIGSLYMEDASHCLLINPL